MAPRAVYDIFEQFSGKLNQEVKEESGSGSSGDEQEEPTTPIKRVSKQASVFVSIQQIYNEVISDLLSNTKEPKTLQLKQNQEGGFYSNGLSQINVKSPAKIMELLRKAQDRRCSTATKLNEFSSRSHLILTLTLVEVDKNEDFVGAKLNLVDLAGSERVKDSMATG